MFHCLLLLDPTTDLSIQKHCHGYSPTSRSPTRTTSKTMYPCSRTTPQRQSGDDLITRRRRQSSNWRRHSVPFVVPLALLIAFQSLTVPVSSAGYGFSPYDYGKLFSGDGTYYGLTSGGNCAMGPQSNLPHMYRSMVPIAINNDQYDNSKSCGACLLVTGRGRGSGGRPIRGTFRAYIHDRCPECSRGDVDLSASGDGRWHVSWKFVACPMNDAYFAFEGSNNFYKKIQVRGLRYPAKMMWINGKRADRSQDNFFIAHGSFPYSGSIRVVDVKGNVFSAWTNLNLATGVFKAPASFNTPVGASSGSSSSSYKKPYRKPYYRPKKKSKKRYYKKHGGGGYHKKRYYYKPKPKRKARTCVPDWMACTGRTNYKGLPCCGWPKGYKCKYVPWSIFRHCMR